jgi:hypothetical protein
MSDALKRQSVLWLLLGGLPLVAIADIRRPTATPSPSARAAAGSAESVPEQRAARAFSADRPERLPEVRMSDEDWFLDAQAQLRARGVEYVRLEKWHCEPVVYYFECRLPVEDEPATYGPHRLTGLSVSAQAATQDVVAQVGRLRQVRRVSRATQTGAADDGRLDNR